MINKNSRKNFSLKAFSLIEISVVIIIIGILIAGVSKGLDLYQDFKLTTARQLTKNSIVPRINDLRLWLDATTENAIINQNNSLNIKDGDTVKSFRDMNLSGFSGYSFTQDTTSYQPKYTKNGINNLPCIYFDSNNQNLRLIATIKENFSLESTIFAVVYMDSINPSNNNQAMLISVGGSYGAMEMWNMPGNSARTYFWNGQARDQITMTLKLKVDSILRKFYNPNSNSSSMHSNGSLLGSSTATYSGFYDSARLHRLF